MMRTDDRFGPSPLTPLPRKGEGGPAEILRGQGGQSLLLALGVMFLMVFIGGLFIGIVGRNIMRAQKSGEVLSVQYLAEAGIRYADHQLTYSDDGADWRPVPEYPELVKNLEGVGPAPAANQLPDPSDPDYTWLMQGYSRYTYGKGRFLLKVSYQPRPDDPMSKFIRIDTVGRMGVVDVNDPTTYQNKQPIRLRKELVAYKPVAITDYARFITNKDRVPTAATLGAPNYITEFGELKTDAQSNKKVYGAPIRVNGDLIWHGRNIIWLDPLRGQGVEVAGDIRHEDSMGDPKLSIATEVIVSTPGYADFQAEESNAVNASNQPIFNTAPGLTTPALLVSDRELGWYRDGNQGGDIYGRPREILRLEPPNLDSVGVAGRLSRYRELTRNSGEWRSYTDGSGVVTWYNTGYWGWGDGIYIDNSRDVQTESVGYTMRADWTQPGSSQYWHGPYYDPPGITVELFPYDLDDSDPKHIGPADGPDMIITRDESARYIWKDMNGNPLPASGEQIIMPYPKNGVLFAEGNVHIKGMLPPCPRRKDGSLDTESNLGRLTVVSGRTIYVDGNILKYRDPKTPTVADPNCSIALLADDYVCVNTTKFFAPLKEVPFPGPGSGFFDVSSTSAFWFNFAFGEDPTMYNRSVELFVRHTAAPGGASYVNMLVNWPPTDTELAGNSFYSFYQFNLPLPTSYIYALGDPVVWPNRYAIQQYESWEHQVFGLWPTPNGAYNFNVIPGAENRIGFQLDQSQSLPMAPQDYYVSRAAIQPMDIRIEAIMYAQNKSFFVIPGEWFNPDPDDVEGSTRRSASAVGIEERWPYYGQPLDVRVTVYGAISENMPASVGDASAWMEKWGWIPDHHGSSAESTKDYRPSLDPNDTDYKRRKGLTIIYDDLLSHPVLQAGTVYTALRTDEYGRPLPIAPKLPVSPQILYTGKPT